MITLNGPLPKPISQPVNILLLQSPLWALYSSAGEHYTVVDERGDPILPVVVVAVAAAAAASAWI